MMYLDMMMMLIHHVLWCSNLAAQDCDGCTALMLAAQYGHCGIVETLLRHSEAVPGQCLALVNTPNKLGQTALHEAAKRGHVAIAAALIFAGAAVDAADRWNNRPLCTVTRPSSRCLLRVPRWSRTLSPTLL